MKTNRKVALSLAVILMLSMTASAFAANEPYSFSMSMPKGNTTMYIDTSSANQKFYNQQDGTIRCTTQNAPGYGYRIGLAAKSNYAGATNPVWMTSGQKKYTSFYLGMGTVGAYFHAAGRPDNDYTGTYSISGTFNSDKT